MSENKCRATGCDVLINADFVMCNRHWKMVPIPLRNAIWRHARNRQPTTEYLRLLAKAIDVVTAKKPDAQI